MAGESRLVGAAGAVSPRSRGLLLAAFRLAHGTKGDEMEKIVVDIEITTVLGMRDFLDSKGLDMVYVEAPKPDIYRRFWACIRVGDAIACVRVKTAPDSYEIRTATNDTIYCPAGTELRYMTMQGATS